MSSSEVTPPPLVVEPLASTRASSWNLLGVQWAEQSKSSPSLSGARDCVAPGETVAVGGLGKSEPSEQERLLVRIIHLQGCLARFNNLQVRADFLAGQFGVLHNSEDMLHSLDIIYSMMLPAPPGPGGRFSAGALAGVNFFTGFMSRESGEPAGIMGEALPVRMTYFNWYSYLGDLSASSYWNSYVSRPMDARREKITHVEPRLKGAGPFPLGCSKAESSVRPKIDTNSDLENGFSQLNINVGDWPRTERVGSWASERVERRPQHQYNSVQDKGKSFSKKSLPKRQKYHQSDDTSDSSSELGSGDLRRMLQNFRYPKEAVDPTVFTGKDGNSMRDFLDEFETYFENKYDGNEQQQSRILAQFLDGPARRAYDAMDGSRMRYPHLYAELLSWYKSERTSLRNRSESDFRKARPGPHDSLKTFTYRGWHLKLFQIHLQSVSVSCVANLGKLCLVHSSTC